ncbi:hypothetical protein F2Q69_00013149 [Brassica cretica]|uniref:Uncharacterized protein n=1 Tax=Brassica cretica TaxID=69181 RepID=A0A8S9QVQ0_BRACR|nr:hypothetical protein F2Q69_00013149 [Brassica cretica]
MNKMAPKEYETNNREGEQTRGRLHHSSSSKHGFLASKRPSSLEQNFYEPFKLGIKFLQSLQAWNHHS